MLHWAHTSPTKQHLDQFSHFAQLTAELSSGMPGHVLSPKNCPLALGDLDPPPITWFLESTPQTASRSAQPFLQGRRTWTVQSYSTTVAPIGLCIALPYVTHVAIGTQPSALPKQHLDQFSHFSTAHGSASSGARACLSP